MTTATGQQAEVQGMLLQLRDSANRADTYPLYAQIRERGPLHLREVNLAVFSSYRACDEILRHPSTSSDRFKSTITQRIVQRWPTVRPLGAPGFVFMDPPDHTRLRKLVSKAFAPKVVKSLQSDIAAVDEEIVGLLAATDGQILTTLAGVGTIRAAAFAAHSLPIERFPDAEHLYSATGLAPALYQSATLHRRGRISRQGLAEHRDALMGIAWGLSQCSPSFIARDTELRARGMAPVQARVAVARHACRLVYRLLRTQQPFDEQRYRRGRLGRER